MKKIDEERIKGISAFVIVKDNVDWLGPCIESIVPFFDEVLIISYNENEDVLKIIKSFISKKVKKIQKPATNNGSNTYGECKKWAILNTRYSHICGWDVNMLMLQEHISDETYEKFIANDFVKFRGYNVASTNLKKVLASSPYTKLEKRAGKVSTNILVSSILKTKKIKEPLYLNTTFIDKDIKDIKKIDVDLPNFFFKKPTDYIK